MILFSREDKLVSNSLCWPTIKRFYLDLPLVRADGVGLLELVQSQGGPPVGSRDERVHGEPAEQGGLPHSVLSAEDHLLTGHLQRGHTGGGAGWGRAETAPPAGGEWRAGRHGQLPSQSQGSDVLSWTVTIQSLYLMSDGNVCIPGWWQLLRMMPVTISKVQLWSFTSSAEVTQN